MSVTRSDITSYVSPLSLYCVYKYNVPEVIDFRLTSDDSGSAACLICRLGLDSGNEESLDAGSSFTFTPTIVSTPEA